METMTSILWSKFSSQNNPDLFQCLQATTGLTLQLASKETNVWGGRNKNRLGEILMTIRDGSKVEEMKVVSSGFANKVRAIQDERETGKLVCTIGASAHIRYSSHVLLYVRGIEFVGIFFFQQT